jgi:hypothetical protein
MDQGEPHCIAFGGLRVDDAIEQAALSFVGLAPLRPLSRPRGKPTSDAIRCAKRSGAITKRRAMQPIAPSVS